jgi:hypothetical protein
MGTAVAAAEAITKAHLRQTGPAGKTSITNDFEPGD